MNYWEMDISQDATPEGEDDEQSASKSDSTVSSAQYVNKYDRLIGNSINAD